VYFYFFLIIEEIMHIKKIFIYELSKPVRTSLSNESLSRKS